MDDIDYFLKQLKRVLSIEGIRRSEERHSFYRSRSQMRRWKDRLARSRKRRAEKKGAKRYEEIRKERRAGQRGGVAYGLEGDRKPLRSELQNGSNVFEKVSASGASFTDRQTHRAYD